MIDALVWVALTMSFGTAVLAVWVFNHLAGGGVIVGDNPNIIELNASIVILVLLVIAWCGFTIRKFKR